MAGGSSNDENKAALPEAGTPREWLCSMLMRQDVVYSETALSAVAKVLEAERKQGKSFEASAALAKAFAVAKAGFEGKRLIESFGEVGIS